MIEPFLSVSNLSKAFGAVQALRGATLSIGEGEIHGLVGENGAGKSTLIKILSGVYSQDAGDIIISGLTLDTGNVANSESMGVCVVHQESTAFRDLGLAENLFVGHEPTRLFGLLLDMTKMRQRAQEWMSAIGQDASFSGPLSERSIAQQQLVAIARAVATDCRLLILDEPTASLSIREVEALKTVVRGLAERGVSILYVSHRLEEIFDLCNSVTVMRDGATVARWNVHETSRNQLIQAMVGREVVTISSGGGTHVEVCLAVERLSKTGQFEQISFKVHKGEILGIGGLVGSGRSNVINAIFGATRADSGSIEVNGKSLTLGSIEESMLAGIALVPEDRQHQGLILPLSIAENLVMSVRKRLARFGFIAQRLERDVVAQQTKELAIKLDSPYDPMTSLSGGNQQKVVLGKWLATSPTVLIVDEPTRGVDVGAKAEIHALLRRHADAGAAVLVVSSDMPELLHLSDRVMVMREGKVTGTITREEASPESLLNLAVMESPSK